MAAPKLIDGEYVLELSEFEEERSTIDQVKLLAVDHALNTDIAVTENGEIIEYVSAFKMKEGGCQCLESEEKLSSFDGKAYYTSLGDKFIMAFEPVLEDYASMENIKGGALLGGWVENDKKRVWAPAPPPKTESVGNLGGDEISIVKPIFTFRQRGTLVFVPLEEFSTNIVVSFSKRVSFDYASLVAVVPNPTYNVQELPLKNAMHKNKSNIVSELGMKDGITEELYPGEMIRLTYSGIPLEPGKVRSFILVTTGLYERVGSEVRRIPLQFVLDESYPNPFNPQTTIKYGLVQAGHVCINIYNQLGQEIINMVDQVQEAGYYERHWDATNVPSGTYYVQMVVRDQSGKQLYQETKKLLLMK